MIVKHKKNTAFELVIPIVDPALPALFKAGESPTDDAYYKDGAGAWTALAITDTFAEIGSTGLYEISLTAAEMNHDWVAIKIASTNGADSCVTFKMFTNDIDSVKSKVDDVETDTQDIQGRLPAALASGRMSSDAVAISGSTTAADNVEANIGNLDAAVSTRSTVTTAQVNAEVDQALLDYDGPTDAEMIASFLALNDLSAAEVNAEADQALADYDPPTKAEMDAGFAASGGETRLRTGTAQGGGAGSITLDAGASAQNDWYKNAILVITGGTGADQHETIDSYNGTTKVATMSTSWVTAPDATSTFTILPLGTIPGASAPTAAQVADAVWDEARADHDSSGSAGETINHLQADAANKKVTDKETGATELYEDDQSTLRLTRTLTKVDDNRVALVTT